jgi:hypothetical protein
MVTGNMNPDKYTETLDNNSWQVVTKHFGREPFIFQDDNAPCHRSRTIEEWKRQNDIPQLSWSLVRTIPWPKSDRKYLTYHKKLNKKNRLHLVHNVENLKAELLRAWFEIPVFHVQRLYSSLPRRCRQVLIQKGDIMKYWSFFTSQKR